MKNLLLISAIILTTFTSCSKNDDKDCMCVLPDYLDFIDGNDPGLMIEDCFLSSGAGYSGSSESPEARDYFKRQSESLKRCNSEKKLRPYR